jgi:hypothetical protein
MDSESTRPAISRPEFSPDRTPQPLKRNFGERMNQLRGMVVAPSEQQVRLLADKMVIDDPELTSQSPGRPEKLARFQFELLVKDMESYREVQRKIVEVRERRLALSSDQKEERAKARAEQEALMAEREFLKSEINEVSRYLRDAGVQVEPAQQSVGIGEKMQSAAFTARWQVAAGGARVGEVAGAAYGKVAEGAGAVASGVRSGAQAVAEGAGAVGGAIKSGAESVTGGVKSGVEFAATQGGKAVEAGRLAVKNVVESGTNAVKTARNAGLARFNSLRESVSGGLASARAAAFSGKVASLAPTGPKAVFKKVFNLERASLAFSLKLSIRSPRYSKAGEVTSPAFAPISLPKALIPTSSLSPNPTAAPQASRPLSKTLLTTGDVRSETCSTMTPSFSCNNSRSSLTLSRSL